MVRKLLASALMLGAALVVSSTIDTAQARRGGHGGHIHFGGHHHFAVRHLHAPRFFHHRRHFRGPVIVSGFYGYPSCAWLRHRAIVTGSPYWWNRYWRCRHGYYY